MLSSAVNVLKSVTSSIGNKISTTVANSSSIVPSISGNYLFADFCSAAKFYSGFAFLTLIYLIIINDSIGWVIVKSITFIAWAFFLQLMCKSGYRAIAWLAAIIPHSIFILITVKTS